MTTMTADSEAETPLHALEGAFDSELGADNRAAAETAYALAFRYRNEDVNGQRRFDLAKLWAERSIALLEVLPSETLDAVASTRAYVGGIPIPGLLHAEVVRERLGDVLV